VLFLTIRQAEVALADGRLDEAYQLLQSQALRSHRRGQNLVTELIDKLVERGRVHLASNRLTQALMDCEKAQTLGGNLDQVLALRNAIEHEVVENDRARRQGAREGAIDMAAALVDSALARQDVDRAVAELVRARGNGCSDQRLRQQDGAVRSMLREQIEDALNAGRLDQVDALMDRLTRLDPESLPTQRLARAIEQAQAAWESIQRGGVNEAVEILHRLAVQLPEAKWIKQALENLETAQQALATIRTGPLGLLAMNQPQFKHDTPTTIPLRRDPGVAAAQPAQHGRGARVTTEMLPPKFILQVDGAGSYMVLTKTPVTLGPISSSQLPDVPLIAEPGAAVASIERIDDDYFHAGKLLSSGDRIAISPRCKLTFLSPNPSSTTAVLDLSSGRFPRADLRRIILLDRELVIGPGSASHIRADHLSEPIALHIRDGRLWCRSQEIAVGTPATVAGASFVVTMG
jgi:hypothetical protein